MGAGETNELGGGIRACVARCRNPGRLPATGLKGDDEGSITLGAGFPPLLAVMVLWLRGAGGGGGSGGGGGGCVVVGAVVSSAKLKCGVGGGVVV